MFSCVICNEIIGESTYSTPCGHLYHFRCIMEWLNRSLTCPTCRSSVLHNNLIKLFMPQDKRYEVTTKEELDLLVKKLRLLGNKNMNYNSIFIDMKNKINESQDAIRKSNVDYENLYEEYRSTRDRLENFISAEMNTPKNVSTEEKYQLEKSKNILLKKEMYELQSIHLAELNKLKSELSLLQSEEADFPSKFNDINYEQPSTSKVNFCNKNRITEEIQLSKLQLQLNPSTVKGFLSDCHFLIVNEYKELNSDRLYFNEQRIMEHGGTVADHYSNKVTHLICNSQKNNEVVRGLSDHKKCVTDYWLSDIISEKKIIKPWLSHHLPIPYSYDNLPCEDNQIAIVNFNKNEYFKAKVMAEILGACVTSNVSNSTHIVISQNLEGGIIRRALTLEIPIVNVLWIIDLFLGEKIGFHDSNKTKYQQYELSDPFSINSVRVSHLMEAWKDCSSNHIKFVSNKVANMPTSAKRMKTCFIHDFSKSGNNNDESESNVTSAITIPMENDNTSSRYSTD